MPNAKRNRRTRRRREPSRLDFPSLAAWCLREFSAMAGQSGMASGSRRHLRNATIELLEAMRAVLDETIQWLRHDGRVPAELKKIRVVG